MPDQQITYNPHETQMRYWCGFIYLIISYLWKRGKRKLWCKWFHTIIKQIHPPYIYRSQIKPSKKKKKKKNRTLGKPKFVWLRVCLSSLYFNGTPLKLVLDFLWNKRFFFFFFPKFFSKIKNEGSLYCRCFYAFFV